jgi:hypothetical protein
MQRIEEAQAGENGRRWHQEPEIFSKRDCHGTFGLEAEPPGLISALQKLLLLAVG